MEEAEDGPTAVEAILKLRPDLVLLDVQMPGGDGFDVLSRVAPDYLPNVIFVTAYDHYALKAFAVHAVDYLLKPITHRRFQEALRRVRATLDLTVRAESADRLRAMLDARDRQVSPLGDSSATAPLSRVPVRDGDQFVLLRLADVDWIEAAANYVRMHVGSRAYEVRMTMQEVERRVDTAQFRRIHRSTIVNLERVTTITPDWHGDFTVVLTSGTTHRLSRRYRDQLLR